jgi:N-acetylneuraminic acid mutarotase
MRLPPLHLALSVAALAACAEDQTPTQPGSDTNAQPVAPVVAALTSNNWTIKAAQPDFAFANQASYGVMPEAGGNPVVYQLGGRDEDGGSGASVFEYRIATNTWSVRSYDPRIYAFNTNGVARIGNLLYVSGGETYAGGTRSTDGSFWAYNPVTDVLTQKPTPPKLTSDGVSGVIDGKLYVLPGRCSSDYFPNPFYCETEAFRRLFRYNPGTNVWATRKQAPHMHLAGAGGAINGKFYVAGGSGTNTLDRYDPASDSWTTLAPIPVKGGFESTGGPVFARGTVFQGKLFVVTSHYNQNRGILWDAFSYDPATNAWTRKARPTYVHSDIVAITWNGKPYLLGLGGMGVPVELYTP